MVNEILAMVLVGVLLVHWIVTCQWHVQSLSSSSSKLRHGISLLMNGVSVNGRLLELLQDNCGWFTEGSFPPKTWPRACRLTSSSAVLAENMSIATFPVKRSAHARHCDWLALPTWQESTRNALKVAHGLSPSVGTRSSLSATSWEKKSE